MTCGRAFAVAVMLLLAVQVRAGAAVQIYFNDFSNAADPLVEWSSAPTFTAPSGERFLGRFSSESATLTLPIPAGNPFVSVTFDLYMIDSWDGQGPAAGPDTWGLQVVGGPTLLQRTFNNMDGPCCFAPFGAQGQSFGGQGLPAGTYPARAGASATDSLGIQSGEFWDSRDSTYRLSFVFPFAQPSLSVNFYDLGLQGVPDESWGLDNVRVQAIPEPASAVMLLAGLGLIAALRRLRQARRV